MTPAVAHNQNWSAYLELELIAGEVKTHLTPKKRFGPLSVQRPFYPEQDYCHVYLLHPPGGVVGGDQLDLNVHAQENSHAVFTTPGATKFYLSAGQTALVNQQFSLQSASSIEFLPQENIYFPGAQVSTHTSLDVVPGSVAILWEKHCFGRPANDETFASGKVTSEISVSRQGKLIFREKQRIDASEINRASGLRGNPVCGSLLIHSDKLDDSLTETLRQIEPAQGYAGITRVRPELLVARYLGQSTSDLNYYFTQLWDCSRNLVLNRNSCHPRIWST
jgi:urease accessory protein